LVAQLKGCGKSKSDDEFNFLILSKLKGPYRVLSSTFYSMMYVLVDKFKMPSLEFFCECLTREQSKLMQLDALSNSKNQALVAHSSKGKHKAPYKKKKYVVQGSETPPQTPIENKIISTFQVW